MVDETQPPRGPNPDLGVASEFTPTQLDAIEDALEQLESVDDLSGLGLDDMSTERLGEFQAILAMSREAFPTQEPAPELLAGVLAEARQSAAAPVQSVAPETADDPARGGGWMKWLPWLTLAGSAVVVLLLVRPPSQSDAGAQTLADASDAASSQDPRGEEKSAASAAGTPEVPQAGSAAGTAEEVAADTPSALYGGGGGDKPEPEPNGPLAAPSVDVNAPGELPQDATPQKTAPRKTPASKSKAKPSKTKPPTPATQGSEPGAAPSKDAAWDRLTRAHSLRRRGECVSARQIYSGLTADTLPANLRAQAKAGMGLCREFEGDSGQASSDFSSARDAMRDIDGWIAAEREEMRAVGKAPKKKQARQPAAFDALDDDL